MRDVEETFPSGLESVLGCSQFWNFRSPDFKINLCRGPGGCKLKIIYVGENYIPCYEGPKPKKGFELPSLEAPSSAKSYISRFWHGGILYHFFNVELSYGGQQP